MVPGAIDGTVDIFRALQCRKVRLYAITNLAADTFVEASKRFPFLTEFRRIVVSGTVRILKPDPEIYRCLAAVYALDLERGVFIDDVPANCDTAECLGMTAIHFTGPAAARMELERLGFDV